MKRIKHESSERGAVHVTEQPYMTGDIYEDGFEMPKEVRKSIEKYFALGWIEFEAKCPECKTDMEMMNELLEKPVSRKRDVGNGELYEYVQTAHDIFICPKCGFKRERKVGRIDPDKLSVER